jgi:hypothetical protein
VREKVPEETGITYFATRPIGWGLASLAPKEPSAIIYVVEEVPASV